MSSRWRPGGFAARAALVLTALVLTAPGSVLALLSGLWQAAGHILLAPSVLPAVAVTALAGAVLAGVLACLARGGRPARISAALPLISRAAALRDKSWRAAFLRQRDPDAAGRPRPRAPSAAPAAAAS
jgi:hypothetical protein